MSDNLKGALLTSLTIFLYTLNDGLMKLIISYMPLSQAVFLRNLIILPMMCLLAWQLKLKLSGMSRRIWAISIFRGLNEIAVTICLLLAFKNMLLSDAISILQAVPLLLTAVASLLFGERVSAKRWMVIFVGLIGVLIIIKPGTDAFNWASLYAIGAVCFLTIRDSLSKSLPDETPVIFPAFVATLIVFVSSIYYTPGEAWITPSQTMYGLIFICSLFMFGATYLSITMMRIGDVGFTSPFRYSAILWSAIIGILFFAEWPDHTTWIGAAILVGSGIYLIRNGRS